MRSLLLLSLFALLLVLPLSLAASCDDQDACTFDWSESQPSGQSLCVHELIPPPCQPLLVHAGASEHSSLTAHQRAFDDVDVASAVAMDSALDVHLLVSIAGDTELIVNRVRSFIDNLSRLAFPAPLQFDAGDVGATELRQVRTHPAPAWSLSIYNQSHIESVHPLTRCLSCLRGDVESVLFDRIRRMDTFEPLRKRAADISVEQAAAALFDGEPLPEMEMTEQVTITTPVGIYNAIGAFVKQAQNSSAPPTHRPYAHSHVIVLDGIGEMPDQRADRFLRVQAYPSAEEIAAHDASFLALLNTMQSPARTLSMSFSMFFDSEYSSFFNASIGSPLHAAAYKEDHSHFNSARTLRNLIRDSVPSSAGWPAQAASFQAQMLSRQVTVRTYSAAYLEVIFNGQLANIWEAHYRQPSFARKWCSAASRYRCDKKQGWIQEDNPPCAAGELRSILHGCDRPIPRGIITKVVANLTAEDAPVGANEANATEVEVEISAPGSTFESLDPDSFGTLADLNSTLPIVDTASAAVPLNLPGAPFPLFHMQAFNHGSRRWTREHLCLRTDRLVGAPPAVRTVEVQHWTPSELFTRTLIQGGRPAILKNTIVATWPALSKWSAEFLRDAFAEAGLTHNRTKVSRTHTFFDPDSRTPLALKELVNLTMSYAEEDLQPAELFGNVTLNYTTELADKTGAVPEFLQRIPPRASPLYYSFGAFPPSLLPDITPYASLFDSSSDLSKKSLFLWVSSAGVQMHSHFDQDNNFFVQLRGVKRFTLWMPEQWEQMYSFPRIHPMWHKSQVNYDAPDLQLFPQYARTVPMVAEVGPGDVLYIPPYVWHHVETVTPSVSMSVWSRDGPTVDLMEKIYRHDHKFDLLADPQGRLYALRLHIDLMIYEMYGANQTTVFMQNIVNRRYRGIVDMMREEATEDDQLGGVQAPLCPTDKIPTAHHVYGDAVLDRNMLVPRFDALSSDVRRDLLFVEYLEEISAGVVGATRVMRFFMQCFQGQTYQITQAHEERHQTLWRHV